MNEPMHAAGGTGGSSSGGARPSRRVVTWTELEAVRLELRREIADGDARVSLEVGRMIADLQTAFKRDMAAQFTPLALQVQGVATAIDSLNDFMRQQKADEEEEGRLRHEEDLKAQLLGDIHAKDAAEAKRIDDEQRRKDSARKMRWRPVTSALLTISTGLAMGGTLVLLQQAQNGMKANAALLLVIIPYSIIVIIITVMRIFHL